MAIRVVFVPGRWLWAGPSVLALYTTERALHCPLVRHMRGARTDQEQIPASMTAEARKIVGRYSGIEARSAGHDASTWPLPPGTVTAGCCALASIKPGSARRPRRGPSWALKYAWNTLMRKIQQIFGKG